MGGSPTSCAKRAAKAERDMATSSAREATVQARAGTRFSGFGGHEAQRAGDPLHLRAAPRVDTDHPRQETDQLLRGRVIEADRTADETRGRAASSHVDDLVAVADFHPRQLH